MNIGFADYAAAGHVAATQLQPLMDTATTSWWFIRKAPHWRLRWIAAIPSRTTRDLVLDGLTGLSAAAVITGWTETIYEPEVHAFGGPDAMTAAHHLFDRDSRHILHGIDQPPDSRRAHSIMLCTALCRAAGQDWYEQGDIWARIAENRPLTGPDPTSPTTTAAVRRLLTVDTAPDSVLTSRGGQLAAVEPWFAAFRYAGAELGRHHHHGRLRRGLRAILAHHVLFHWNRLGLDHQTQATIAHLAQQVILGEQPHPDQPHRASRLAAQPTGTA